MTTENEERRRGKGIAKEEESHCERKKYRDTFRAKGRQRATEEKLYIYSEKILFENVLIGFGFESGLH